MSKVAAKAKLTRDGLYRMLSEDGNPEGNICVRPT